MSTTQDASLPVNRLLAALPSDVYQRLLPHLTLVSLTIEQVLYEIDEPIDYIYFPHPSVTSLIAPTQDGSLLELAVVGQEGVVGIFALLGSRTKAHRAFVQVAGSAMRIDAAVLKTEFERGGALQRLLLRYLQLLLTQISQTGVCNRFHNTEERLARWLLLVRDCVQSNEFLLTQEFIGEMLGTRRSSVTVAAGSLSQAGLISYSRGRIRILDDEALEDFSCECYGVIREELTYLFDTNSV